LISFYLFFCFFAFFFYFFLLGGGGGGGALNKNFYGDYSDVAIGLWRGLFGPNAM
jgi:hypothetical protein